MSFIGNVPAESYTTVVKDTFSGNDSTTDFTLSIPATTNSVEVFVENVQQEPTDAYTISGTTLSFTAAPVTGTDNIYVIHRGPAVQQVVPPAGVGIDASTVTASGDVSIADKIVHTGDTNTAIRFPAADTVTVETGGSERVRVDSSGNVGIGTSSPTERLTVVAGQVGTSAEGGVGLWNYNSTQKWNIQTGVAGSQNSSFTINDDTASATRMLIDTSGNLQFNSGYGSAATAYGCRAWVNFDGTGTVSIRGDGNVSSITDNGTGDYTVNFTTAMPDANYSAPFSNADPAVRQFLVQSNLVAGSVQVRCQNGSGSNTDTNLVCVAVFR